MRRGRCISHDCAAGSALQIINPLGLGTVASYCASRVCISQSLRCDRKWRIGRRRRTERKNANRSFLFGNTSFDEVALKFREICLQQ